ncbi:unnamed protein product [Protopolystoma xenopodis]|uniref:phosphatidate cytidylyltransferase n=1 Tax=Protopolystoma xenopodis TaxID=117903 RepID=A0A3S5AEI5_9PLAT|nr:unnamed protein product [Protopolystoma xenopodis]
MVICNDIMAYVFGFFFGRTPLIKLSPKKTWEGFIGGGLSTLVLGVVLSSCLVRHNHFVCPIDYDDVAGELTMNCVRSPVFTPKVYNVSSLLVSTV